MTAMSKITIFTISDCNFCERLKIAFRSRDIEYTEISLTDYPDKRMHMLELSDHLTVPQAFFNGKWVGGADDTIRLLEAWEQFPGPSPIDYYKGMGSVQYGPVDIRLIPPFDEKPRRPPSPPPRNMMEDHVDLPDGHATSMTVLEITSTLIDMMPRADKTFRGRIYKDCFTGKEGVTALMEHYNLPTRKEAVLYGQYLQTRRLLDHVCEDHQFADASYYYRLQPFHKPNVLNTFRIWNDRVDTNPLAIVERLKILMGRIENRATDSEALVDYISAGEDPDYLTFEEAVCELQGVSLRPMDDNTKLAFCINLYNLMVKHAFIKVGIANSHLSRGDFYDKVCYDVGGDVLSFNDIEHGILRSNTRPPYTASAPFGKGCREALSLPHLDPRVHFTLNCGAKSCPPIKTFTDVGITEELRIVSQAFCEEDCNVSMDVEKNELHLSMIFNWYRSDFAESRSKLPHYVLCFLRNERREVLQDMIDSGKSITIKYKPYDWTCSAKRSKVFACSSIQANERTYKAFFTGASLDDLDSKLRRSDFELNRRKSSDKLRKQRSGMGGTSDASSTDDASIYSQETGQTCSHGTSVTRSTQ